MKSLLYAPRVKGDLDLGLEAGRIAHGNRRWAEIITPGGRLPGRTEQGILEVSDVGEPNYRIGTRRVYGDRVFHYCYASRTGEVGIDDTDPAVPPGVAVAYTGHPGPQVGCFYNSNVHHHGHGLTQVLVPAGVTEFEWAYNLARRGNIAIAAHQLQEAMLVSYSQRACYLIADNDAFVSSNGTIGTVHLYLKEQVWQAFGDTAPGGTLADFGGNVQNSYIYPNKYAQCVHPDLGIAHDSLPYVAQDGGGLGYGGVVAVPLRDVAQGRYFWGQTWGPLPLINGKWGINVGDRANAREFHFDWAGHIVYRAGAEATDAHFQRGGYILSSQFMELQLAP